MLRRLSEAALVTVEGGPPDYVIRAAGQEAVDRTQDDIIRSMLQELALADDATLEQLARGYDREDSAQRGEPDAWSEDLVGQFTREEGAAAWEQWRQERIACAREGLKALILAVVGEKTS